MHVKTEFRSGLDDAGRADRGRGQMMNSVDEGLRSEAAASGG
jgi:hypothetical protein